MISELVPINRCVSVPVVRFRFRDARDNQKALSRELKPVPWNEIPDPSSDGTRQQQRCTVDRRAWPQTVVAVRDQGHRTRWRPDSRIPARRFRSAAPSRGRAADRRSRRPDPPDPDDRCNSNAGPGLGSGTLAHRGPTARPSPPAPDRGIRNTAVCVLRLAGHDNIAAALLHHSATRTDRSSYCTPPDQPPCNFAAAWWSRRLLVKATVHLPAHST